MFVPNISFSLLPTTFSGAGDPNDVISLSEILALDTADIGSFQDSSLSFNAPSYEYVRFDVTDISVTAVPLPAALWLFGSGLLGLLGVARRKKTAGQ